MAEATPKTDIAITTGGKDYLPRAVDLLTEAFATDPVITYLLNVLPPSKQHAYRHVFFNSIFTAASLNGASFAEVDGWRCAGVLMPPGKKADNPLTMLQSGLLGILWNLGLKGVWRVLHEYAARSDALKARTLEARTKEAYYVFNIGTKEEHRGKGLSSHLIRAYQATAAASDAPLWLEATTPYSHALYAKLGFESVGEIRLGEGVADSDGRPEKGGQGFAIWGMVWWPPVNDGTQE